MRRDTKNLFVFGPNVRKDGPEIITAYLDTFHAVKMNEKVACCIKMSHPEYVAVQINSLVLLLLLRRFIYAPSRKC